ncbi:MAG: CopD family protein [Deltaproteobacteria bacterium]|nr:CopD family protein [Deltaproteobacteria bacterium]
MDPWYQAVKTLHIVSVIAWMAGLLYLIRLYVNHRLETVPVVWERFQGMERRLWLAITVPAAWSAALSGGAMAAMNPCGTLATGWFSAKLGAVAALLAVHFLAGLWRKQFLAPPFPLSTRAFRLWNEAPTLLMILIVALVEFQPDWGTWYVCP